MGENLISPLRNERVIVRRLLKEGKITNPKHVLYGGMAAGAFKWFTVPMLRNGQLVDVLTKQEKDFLEEAMGLEANALSVHRKVDNYWSNYKVKLGKEDTILNLNDPEEYIKYKVLLNNTDQIAPSLDEVSLRPKETYEYVLLHEEEEAKANQKRVNKNIEAYKAFGKLENDRDKLRTIVEIATSRPQHKTVSLEILTDQVDRLIQADANLFLTIAQDPLLDTKVLLKKGRECGAVKVKNDLFYDSDGKPLCDAGNATFSVAAEWLNKPKNQGTKLAIEAKIKAAEELEQ
jgi:hypothetical protein